MGEDDVSSCSGCVVDGLGVSDICLKDLSCEFSRAGNTTDEDILNSGSKMDSFEQDFCICRRCRSFSSSWSPRSPSVQDRNLSFSKQKRTSSTVSRYKDEGNGDVQKKLFGSEEDEVPPFGEVNAINLTHDDVPLLLDESYQTESDESTHCHVNKKTTAEVQKARRQLIISSCLCLIFMLAEIIGGYLSNSLAIMTDAAHLLSDLAGFLISLFALWVGQKAPTRRMSFGYYRAEILGAVVSVLFIWVLTGVLVYMAVDRVRFPDYEIDADTMLIVSGGGVVINIIMGLVLHNPCGRHHHGHSHGLQPAQNQIEESTNSQTFQNINVRAAFIHVLGDLVQSIGVLIAAFIIRYKPEYKLADPICTFIFSLLVIFTTLSIMKDAVHVLMEGFPRNLNYGDVKNALTNVKGVKAAHSLHIWSLTVDKNTLSVHLAVDPDMDPHAVLQEAQLLIRRMYKIYHCTIQVEKYDPTCMTDCQACLGPQV